MVQTVEEAREALLTGKAVKLMLSSLTGKIPLILIPYTLIENETRVGLLICLEGRGAYFYDGKSTLAAVEFLKCGFMPIDASRTIAALNEIFPRIEPDRVQGKQDKEQNLITEYRHERHTKQNQTGRSANKPRKPRKPSKPKPSSPPSPNRSRRVGLGRKAGSGNGETA